MWNIIIDSPDKKSICDNCIVDNCSWRAGTGTLDPPIMDCECFEWKTTNADKIRAMTNEELAKFIKDTVVTEFRHHGLIGIFESDGYWLDWLKQEVSDNG